MNDYVFVIYVNDKCWFPFAVAVASDEIVLFEAIGVEMPVKTAFVIDPVAQYVVE